MVRWTDVVDRVDTRLNRFLIMVSKAFFKSEKRHAVRKILLDMLDTRVMVRERTAGERAVRAFIV